MKFTQKVVPVTVIIPCYQCALTIIRAFDSILEQRQKPAEVILVDDASGDDTLSILRKLEKQYPNWVTVVFLPVNAGAASARNAGWEIATQPYIAFLDSDDTWNPRKVEIQYEYMRKNTDVALSGHQCVWLRDGEEPPELSEYLHETKIRATGLLFGNAFSTPTVMLKRELLFRFKEGKRYAEDLLLWQQIAFSGLQVVRIESTLAYVHKPLYGAGGLSMQLWKMEKGELSDFTFLYRTGCISFLLYAVSISFSMAKFMKRVFVTKLKGFTEILLYRGSGT